MHSQNSKESLETMKKSKASVVIVKKPKTTTVKPYNPKQKADKVDKVQAMTAMDDYRNKLYDKYGISKEPKVSSKTTRSKKIAKINQVAEEGTPPKLSQGSNYTSPSHLSS
jgi:hypothetical protein